MHFNKNIQINLAKSTTDESIDVESLDIGVPLEPYMMLRAHQIDQNPNQDDGEGPVLGNSGMHKYDPENDTSFVPPYRKPSNQFSRQATNCTGPNIEITPAGKCACASGFPYGDPSSDIGCWNCPRECHGNAECLHPGECHCRDGYTGDGVLHCDPTIPIIHEINPHKCPITGCDINVTFSLASLPKQIFCKFGHTPVSGRVVDNHTVFCPAPPRHQCIVSLSISVDSAHWSEESFDVEYFVPRTTSRLAAFIIFGLFLIISLGAFAVYVYWQNRRASKDETLPFLSDQKRKGVYFLTRKKGWLD